MTQKLIIFTWVLSFFSSLFCLFCLASLSYSVGLSGFTQFSNTLMENGFMTVLDRPVLLGRKPLESICGIQLLASCTFMLMYYLLCLAIILSIHGSSPNVLILLYKQNVIHGDIKPDNLLVTSSGTVKIGDFSVSQVFKVIKMTHFNP